MGRNISDEEVFTNINDLINKHILVEQPAPALEPAPAPRPEPRPDDPVDDQPQLSLNGGQRPSQPVSDGSSSDHFSLNRLPKELREEAQKGFPRFPQPQRGQLLEMRQGLEAAGEVGSEIMDMRKRIAELGSISDPGQRDDAIQELRQIQDRISRIRDADPAFAQQAIVSNERKKQEAAERPVSVPSARETTIAAVDNVLADIRRDGEVISQELGVTTEDGGLDYKGTQYHQVFLDAFQTVFPDGDHIFHKDAVTDSGTSIPLPSDVKVGALETLGSAPITIPLSMISPLLPEFSVPFFAFSRKSRRSARAEEDVNQHMQSLMGLPEPEGRLSRSERETLSAIDYGLTFSGYTGVATKNKEIVLNSLSGALQQGRIVDASSVEQKRKEYLISAMESSVNNSLLTNVLNRYLSAENTFTAPNSMSIEEQQEKGFLPPQVVESQTYSSVNLLDYQGVHNMRKNQTPSGAMSPQISLVREIPVGLSGVSRFVGENYIGTMPSDEVVYASLGQDAPERINVRRVFSDAIDNQEDKGSATAQQITSELESYFYRTNPEFLLTQDLNSVHADFNRRKRAIRDGLPQDLVDRLGSLSREDVSIVANNLVQAQRAGRALSDQVRRPVNQQNTRLSRILNLEDYGQAISENRPVVSRIDGLYANALSWDSDTMRLLKDVVMDEYKGASERLLSEIGR